MLWVERVLGSCLGVRVGSSTVLKETCMVRDFEIVEGETD
jgi:hypothetical protein